VHARLRVSQKAPGVPVRAGEVEIWLSGSRFHVRDFSGRNISEILGDITEPRGLGVPARSMEDMMDRHSAARAAKDGPPLELFGDLASDEGWVYPPTAARWAMPAKELALVAEQILARDKTTGLKPGGTATRLGRAGTEYRGVVGVTKDGKQIQNAVTRTIAPPFLLFEETHDASNDHFAYARELLSIEENTVTDADVIPR
jgi:hypothetical protein